MKKKIQKRKNINFLLDNKHYKRLHLILYLISITLIVLVYFLTIIVFSSYLHFLVSVLFSFLIGLYIVFNRNKLVNNISDRIENYKRKHYKKESKENLRTTLKKITPKRNIKFNIKSKFSLKEKAANIKNNFKSKKNKKKKSQEYIEIK
ncbi:MAG: hypothetical protein PF569_05105 [Candidatus Woesearchaeota archaeon]|jgi:hypothetical protein|nr:hypothetical protein [Candidatus Woesearchaeota archaeon]